MKNALTDSGKIEELSRIAESEGADSAVEQYVRSLSLPSDEEETIIRSLKMLPAFATAPAGMPTTVAKADPHYWM